MPTTGILYNGTDIGSYFSAKGASTSSITGIKSNGTDLNQILLARADGNDIGFNTGILSNGTDLRSIFGAGSNTLPINGKSYIDSVGRSIARLFFIITSSGTYSITQQNGSSPSTVLDSGTWLPGGDSVSNWQYNFTQVGFTNGPDPGGGTDTYGGDSPTPSAITGSPQFFATAASGAGSGQHASNQGTVTLHLTRTGGSGSIVTTVDFTVDAS